MDAFQYLIRSCIRRCRPSTTLRQRNAEISEACPHWHALFCNNFPSGQCYIPHFQQVKTSVFYTHKPAACTFGRSYDLKQPSHLNQAPHGTDTADTANTGGTAIYADAPASIPASVWRTRVRGLSTHRTAHSGPSQRNARTATFGIHRAARAAESIAHRIRAVPPTHSTTVTSLCPSEEETSQGLAGAVHSHSIRIRPALQIARQKG